MKFERGLEETYSILGVKTEKRKLIGLILMFVLIGIVIFGILIYAGIITMPGVVYTREAMLTIRAVPESGIATSPDEYLTDVTYIVLDPNTNKTIASGTLNAGNDWEASVTIPEGHPGYVYLALIPSEDYYLSEPISDEYMIFNDILYYKVEIPGPEVSVTAEFIKFGSLTILNEGNLTFSGTMFTTNIQYNISKESAFYNLTLVMKFNINGTGPVKIEQVSLNGTTVSFVHVDIDEDGYIDTNETVYVFLSGKDFVKNIKSESVNYVLAVTFSASNITSIENSLTFKAYKFDPHQPFIIEQMKEITVAQDVAEYTYSG